MVETPTNGKINVYSPLDKECNLDLMRLMKQKTISANTLQSLIILIRLYQFYQQQVVVFLLLHLLLVLVHLLE